MHVGDGGNVCLHLTLINDFTFTLYTFLFHFHIVLILVRNLAAEGDGKQELTVVLKYVKWEVIKFNEVFGNTIFWTV